MVPGALGLLEKLGQRRLGVLEVGPGVVHLGTNETCQDHPLGGQLLGHGLLHLLEGSSVDDRTGGEPGQELLLGNHRVVVDQLLEDLLGHAREGNFHARLEGVPVQDLFRLMLGPSQDATGVLPAFEELFPGNGTLLGVASGQGDRLGRLGAMNAQALHLGPDLPGPGGKHVADRPVHPSHLVEVFFYLHMDAELGPQSMGRHQPVHGPNGHLVVVEGLSVEGAGGAVGPDPDVLEDSVAVQVRVEGSAGAVLEDGKEEVSPVNLVAPLPSPGVASDFLGVGEGGFDRLLMDSLKGLPVLLGGLGPEDRGALGHGEGHVPPPGPVGGTGVLDELLCGDRVVPGEEGLEGLGLDDVVLLEAKMSQCLSVPPTGGFPPVQVVILAGQFQVVVTPGGAGDFGQGKHGSSSFLGRLPLGGSSLWSCLLGIGDEDRGRGVNPPLGPLALFTEFLEFLGDDEQALGHLVQLPLVVGQALAALEPFEDVLAGDVGLLEAMASGLLGEVRMDLQVDPKREWLRRLWHVYTLFYADSVDAIRTDLASAYSFCLRFIPAVFRPWNASLARGS